MDYEILRFRLDQKIPYMITQDNHAHPNNELSSKKPTIESPGLYLYNMPTRNKQELHYNCTIVNCGGVFTNIYDLHTHLSKTHQDLIILCSDSGSPERQDSGDSVSTTSTMDTMEGAKKVEEESKLSSNTASQLTTLTVEEDNKVLGEQDAKKTRPTLARWTSKMNRNALANAGASDWRSL